MTQSSRAPGEVIAARYRLDRLLAEGGIGEVWLAEHLHLRQQVAIKFLKDELIADPEASANILARFRLESQVSAMLGRKTAHVVNVYDAGDSEAGPFLAMEFVSGRSLGDELDARGPIQPARLAIVLDQMADALGIAHAAGIVHRDIKPANVLVSEEPDGSLFVKVADFGIAKTTSLELPLDRPKDTTAMTMVGTPDFMSPEQLQGGAAHATMDVWALGVTAYELLTGELPFSGKTRIDMIIRIMNNPFEPPSSRRASLPVALDSWFSKALAKDPADRFASVREMSAAFRAAIELPAEPPRSMGRSFRPASVAASAPEAAVSDEVMSRAPTLRLPAAALDVPATSEKSTLRAALPAEPTRPGGSRRAILTGVVLVVVIACGSLIVRAARDPAPEQGPAAVKPPPTDAPGMAAPPIGAPPTGASPSSAVHDVLPATDPTSTLPIQSPTPEPSKPRSTGANPAPSAIEIAPPPSATVSVPPSSPAPSSTVPKKVNPSNVF